MYPYKTVWDMWKAAFVPKTSSIRPVMSIQYRLVTDGQTDKRTRDESIAQRRTVKSGEKKNKQVKTDMFSGRQKRVRGVCGVSRD